MTTHNLLLPFFNLKKKKKIITTTLGKETRSLGVHKSLRGPNRHCTRFLFG